MNRQTRNIIQYILFLTIGIYLFYITYKDFNLEELKTELYNINYWWVLLALLFGIISHISRAVRWRMLIEPLGYKPGFVNTFLSVLMLYFVNILIPRGGEIARCTAITKYEKVPISKLLGTVVTERIVDIIVLFLMVILVLILQLSKMDQFLLTHPEIQNKISNFFILKNFIYIFFALAILIVLFFIFRIILIKTGLWGKIKVYIHNFKEGILTIRKLEKKGWFIFHSLFIYFLYFSMFYVVFFSYKPTSHITIVASLSAFIAGGLAMLAPVQAGIGAWHFMVFETLYLFGIDKHDGKIFALISHTSTNLLILFAGLLAFILLPVLNSSKKVSRKD
ncbi:MAG: flippase-like domain-containing protein [Chlorobi bacterium]|nr:flippase-like domain-containing protein [Chlorobiota bacterium]